MEGLDSCDSHGTCILGVCVYHLKTILICMMAKQSLKKNS